MTMTSSLHNKFLGIGLYTVPEVSRLTHVKPARIARWIKGYRYRVKTDVKTGNPLWKTRIPKLNGRVMVSFNDLLEIKFVNAFRDLGFSLQKIRFAIQMLSEISDSDFPFSQKKVVTDGAFLFADLKDDQGKPLFLELTKRRNYAFPKVIYPMLKKGVIFNEFGMISKWYPDQDRNNQIVLDPRVSFGHPVIDGTRISVTILANAYEAEGSVERVADWYEIDPAMVRQAVDFHERFLF